MSVLAKRFIAVISSITALFIYIFVFNPALNQDHDKEMELVSKLIKLPGISISTSYIESRIPFYEDYSNEFYPGMKRDSFTSFVYAK